MHIKYVHIMILGYVMLCMYVCIYIYIYIYIFFFITCIVFFRIILQVMNILWTNMTVCWYVAPCDLIEFDRRFRGTCCLHRSDYTSSKHLQNVGQFLQIRRRSILKTSSCSPPRNRKSYPWRQRNSFEFKMSQRTAWKTALVCLSSFRTRKLTRNLPDTK
jgi:hypothetical protein